MRHLWRQKQLHVNNITMEWQGKTITFQLNSIKEKNYNKSKAHTTETQSQGFPFADENQIHKVFTHSM